MKRNTRQMHDQRADIHDIHLVEQDAGAQAGAGGDEAGADLRMIGEEAMIALDGGEVIENRSVSPALRDHSEKIKYTGWVECWQIINCNFSEPWFYQ